MGWPYTQNHKPWHTAVSAACNHTATIISQGGKLSSSWHVNVSRSDLFSRVSFWTPGMDWHHRPPCHACKLCWNGVWIQRHALFCVCTLYYCYIREAWPRVVKKSCSNRLIMNSKRLLNSHQRHKFLTAEASRDIVKFRSSDTVFPGGFQEVYFTADAMLFRQNTRKAGNNAVEMSQAFHDIALFECFTDLNLFKYAFNVI